MVYSTTNNEVTGISYSKHSVYSTSAMPIFEIQRTLNAQSKQSTCFKECYACFGCENKTGIVRILIIFKDRHVQPYHSKGLGESFLLMWLNIGLCCKITKIRATPI